MNKEEALKRLKSLKKDCEMFVSIEPTKEDVQALEITIKQAEMREKLDRLSTDELIKELMKRERTLIIDK